MEAVIDGSSFPEAGRDTSWAESLRAPFDRLAGGDVEALGAIWESAGGRLYALALWRTGNEADARDVVQEVFVKLAGRRLELVGVTDPHLWLMAVAHRTAIDLTRRRKVRAAEPLDRAALVASSQAGPDRAAEAARLSRALSELPAAQREAVSLRHLAGHSFREIAAITGVPLFTAASRCRLGLARLRRLLEHSR
jgi:RNA polymerase sigma-70 factor, ECF subfamily